VARKAAEKRTTKAGRTAPASKRSKAKPAPKAAPNKHPGGRPTDYNPDIHPRLAEAWATSGKIDKQIAEKLGVSESTLNLWKKKHPEFSESLKRGKEGPDDLVEASLFTRATGYTFDSEKILAVSDGQGMGSHVERIKTKEHCPPDVTAIIYWLNNRRPARWRNRHEVTGPGGGPLELANMTREERRALIAEKLAKRGIE
jgi:hypothetical protein